MGATYVAMPHTTATVLRKQPSRGRCAALRLTANIAAAVQALLQHADADGDGSINYREFLAAAMDMQNVSREMALRAAFVEFDTDGSGTLSPEEVIQVGGAALYTDTCPSAVACWRCCTPSARHMCRVPARAAVVMCDHSLPADIIRMHAHTWIGVCYGLADCLAVLTRLAACKGIACL